MRASFDSRHVCKVTHYIGGTIDRIAVYCVLSSPSCRNQPEGYTSKASLTTMAGRMAIIGLAALLFAHAVHAQRAVRCPPANFDSVPNLDVAKYISAPWYSQRQVKHQHDTLRPQHRLSWAPDGSLTSAFPPPPGANHLQPGDHHVLREVCTCCSFHTSHATRTVDASPKVVLIVFTQGEVHPPSSQQLQREQQPPPADWVSHAMQSL
jgi:hypothetical protein